MTKKKLKSLRDLCMRCDLISSSVVLELIEDYEECERALNVGGKLWKKTNEDLFKKLQDHKYCIRELYDQLGELNSKNVTAASNVILHKAEKYLPKDNK